MANISFFKNAFTDSPSDVMTLENLLDKIKSGHWSKLISKLREHKDEATFKRIKSKLPAVTVSGEFKSRDKQIEIEDRLIKHSGLICIDVDKKDNLKMRTKDLVDREALAQFVSCSGEGIKIVYRCTPVKTAAEHRRIYDAVVQRLERKGIKLKVDPIVKSLASLQYVTYDPELFYMPKTKLVIKPLPPVKRSLTKTMEDKPKEEIEKDLMQLNEYIDAIGNKDVTKDYENWLLIMFGLSYSLGEAGREPMHRICANYPDYSEAECNEKYDACLERDQKSVEKPVTLATVFQILIEATPKVALRHLAKKYNKSHAVGVGEDEEHGDLAGHVRYKLFLFKKVFDKESNTLVELVPTALNLNAFETLLKQKGFYRFGKMFVLIQDNIVEEVDLDDILRLVTRHIEQDGDYRFTYKKMEFHFSWEEIVHLWRIIRAHSTTYNQITTSLEHWIPNLLKDTNEASYIPYRNGVLKVTAKDFKLIPYSQLRCQKCDVVTEECQLKCKSLNQQIWKERILPRDFKWVEKPGMFEDFFINVTGRGKDRKTRAASENFKRALWYYGYMLQGSKRQSTARAWLLYDVKTGNNGRSGKTILGTAVGKIRSVVVIDGKQIDLRNRFAFQTVQPWTDVVFVDDPSKYMSLVPLFNMISGELSADRKNQNPVIKAVKFMLASNWILEAEGESEIGRQFVTQLDDFYVRYSKEHNDTITPIVDLHGKEFFTDWDDNDWAQFDSFAVKALRHHLSAEAPGNTIIGSANLIRFIQIYEEELFFDLATAFVQNAKPLQRGEGLMVSRQALTFVITEAKEDMKQVKAGKIAREFLNAIGAKNIEITSAQVGGQVKMMYKISNNLKDLDFGEYSKRLQIN